MEMKITQTEYQEFLKEFAWQRLKSPDYRLGQAFCNHFSRQVNMILGTVEEFRLYYSHDDEHANMLIERCVERE